MKLDISQFKEMFNRKKTKLAMLLLAQTMRRITSGGDDEIRFAPLKFKRPDGTKSRPLYHTGQHLLRSLKYAVSRNGVQLTSSFKAARILQLGTTGAYAQGVGRGVLPPIEPVKARALFIPKSKRASNVTPRQAVKRFKYGKDYVFAKKVNIPPRPFFRLSKGNIREIMKLFGKPKR